MLETNKSIAPSHSGHKLHKHHVDVVQNVFLFQLVTYSYSGIATELPDGQVRMSCHLRLLEVLVETAGGGYAFKVASHRGALIAHCESLGKP